MRPPRQPRGSEPRALRRGGSTLGAVEEWAYPRDVAMRGRAISKSRADRAGLILRRHMHDELEIVKKSEQTQATSSPAKTSTVWPASTLDAL